MSQKLVLGVGGGIAAYKACDLLRRFQDSGFDVTVIPTPAALNFVGTATWEALSGKKVSTQVWENADYVGHVKLGSEARYLVIAPATADLIARIAMGRADDLLTNTVLASTAKKLIVPAMHPKMWLNPATVANVNTLRDRGFIVMEPSVGRLTGIDTGIGRFPETAEILNIFFREVANNRDLEGRRILVTLGGTREDIDDVRFIGNRSSGKQGLAIVENAKARGAIVTVINANTSEISGVENIQVRSAFELQQALASHFEICDALIMAAAVADARPSRSAKGKIKKGKLSTIELEENPDLLTEISRKRKNQILVGFAAESENLQGEAKRKLSAKGVDILYANDIREGAIFGSDMTSGYLVWHEDGNIQEREVTEATKIDIASQLLDLVQSKLN